MKLIHKFKSTNFNSRKNGKILFIIIHYTALKNHREAISYLCNTKNKVSSHYLISQDGDIYNLVDEKKRAWHAGLSFWQGYEDLNSSSIGIELDFSKNKNNNEYSKKMIKSLISLLSSLKEKYHIKNSNILGHSDVAPFRKKDPGPKFPWQILIRNNLAINPNDKNPFKIQNVKKWLIYNKINTNKKIIIFILSCIGYDTFNIKDNNYLISKIIIAYQTRFIKSNITGKADDVTVNILIKHFLNYLLTKN